MYTCRFCLQTEDDHQHFLHPCRCRGRNMYVHKTCFWIWESQKLQRNSANQMRCELCLANYRVFKPIKPNSLKIVEFVEYMIQLLRSILANIILLMLIWNIIICTILHISIWDYYVPLRPMHIKVPNFLLIYLERLTFEEVVINYITQRECLHNLIPNWLDFIRVKYCLDEVDMTTIRDALKRAFKQPPIDLIYKCVFYTSMSSVVADVLFYYIPTYTCRLLLGCITCVLLKVLFNLYSNYVKYSYEQTFLFLTYGSSYESDEETDLDEQDEDEAALRILRANWLDMPALLL